MATEHPRTLEEYCLQFDTTFFNLHISCIFCSRLLNYQDLASFSLKHLSLVLRDSQYYACCRNCCRVSARFEFENHYQCSVQSVNIETVAEKALNCLIVRCYNCLTLLDTAEKYDIVCSGGLFHLVRSQWRGLCRECTPR
uniref:Protein E6 n=1 Tax=Human papillomavirus TaxID=10566 RepID=A0A385PIP6_9PAPI|nr:MAG: E6 protein [Human papillomavirus]